MRRRRIKYGGSIVKTSAFIAIAAVLSLSGGAALGQSLAQSLAQNIVQDSVSPSQAQVIPMQPPGPSASGARGTQSVVDRACRAGRNRRLGAVFADGSGGGMGKTCACDGETLS